MSPKICDYFPAAASASLALLSVQREAVEGLLLFDFSSNVGRRAMVDARLLDELSAVATRKRWFIGLAIGRGCRRLRAALLGVEGQGLACQPSLFAIRHARLPTGCRQLYRLLRGEPGGRRRAAPIDAALLAAQLAEAMAALIDEFSADVAPVWNALAALGVADFGLWHRAGGLAVHVSLGDAARLADLTGQNVIDGFAMRDLAQDGRGRPLRPLADWLLLHDREKSRLLVERGRQIRLTLLPASRDCSGATRCRRIVLDVPDESEAGQAAWLDVAELRLRALRPMGSRIDQFLLSDAAERRAKPLIDSLVHRLGEASVDVIRLSDAGVPDRSLSAAGAAILAMLHLDQVPANLVIMTGARTPRVLGRLTPGSYASWNRLTRQLATAKPSVVALRTAV